MHPIAPPIAPPYSAFAAVALGAAALLLSALSVPSAFDARAEPGATATIDLSLIITGLGPLGAATHHFYNPQMVVARKGDTVRLRVMNQSLASHAIQFEGYGVRTAVLPGGPRGQETITFVANKGGVFPFRCYIPYDPVAASCSPDHDTMVGYLVVIEGAR